MRGVTVDVVAMARGFLYRDAMKRILPRVGLVMGVALATALSAASATAESPTRWTAATPDALVAISERAAQADGPDAMARLALIYLMHDEAAAGSSRAALQRLGEGTSSIADDARWLARQLLPEAPQVFRSAASARVEVDASEGPAGLIREFALLGPFEDNGGGLDKREGPETPGHNFISADYSWGAYQVKPVRSLVDAVDARGLTLGLYTEKRRESCSYLSSAITLPAKTVQLHVAASGAIRILWDGKRLARDPAVHALAMMDRSSHLLAAAPGEHLLTIKNCSGARGDIGRVRVRFSDESGADLRVEASSDLATLQRLHNNQTPQSKTKPLINSLKRGLALGKTPTPQQALSAALIRTGLGADDQRSTRAPGLLDRALQAPTTSADDWAIAGYISNFGANSSSRLNRAITLAKQTGDGDAHSFAMRRQLMTRLRNSNVDLARAMVSTPPLKSANDVQARFLKIQTLGRLGGRGLQFNNAAELQALTKELGTKTPLVVWEELARIANSGTPQLRMQTQQQLASLGPGHRRGDYIRAFHMLSPDWVGRAVMHSVLHQRHVGGLAMLADNMQQLGRYLAAKEILQLATRIAPNSPALFTRLAKVERLSASPGAEKRALQAMQRALQLDPQDAQLKSALAFRKGELAGAPKAGEDAEYLVEPKVFLARAKAKPAPETGMFARQLHWRRVVRFHPDKRVSQLVHYAREIIIEPRTEQERYENVPAGIRDELLVARVHKKDGSVVKPEQKQDSGATIRWPKLERGDVVEVAVRGWTPGPVGKRGDPPFYFVDYVGSTRIEPVLYNEVIFDAPKGAPLAWDVLGGKADTIKRRTKGNRQITQLIWNNPPIIADEPWAPRTSEMLPLVVGSVYPSWATFLDWYKGAIEGFTEPDEQIKRLAAQLTVNKTTREQKLKALFNFVADDIRYVNFVSGEWWLPNRPQQLLARRQGDCDDKAMLLISLLKASNIEAKEVLVQTRLTAQRRVMRSTKAAIPMFDHGIIYLPNKDGKGGRFLDATSPQSRVGALPGMDSGAMVILVDDKAQVLETPQSTPSDHGTTATWTMKLAADGSASVHAAESHIGDSAFRLRTNLKEADARAQWIEQNLIGRWLSGVEVEKEVLFNGEMQSGLAEVEYRAKSGSAARREGKDLIVVVAPPVSVTATLAPLTKRTLPVELPPWIAPTFRKMTIEVIAPPGYRIAQPPPNATIENEFGKASVRFTVAKDKTRATIERNVTLAKSRIAVNEYPAWRNFLRNLDQLSQRGVRITAKP